MLQSSGWYIAVVGIRVEMEWKGRERKEGRKTSDVA